MSSPIEPSQVTKTIVLELKELAEQSGDVRVAADCQAWLLGGRRKLARGLFSERIASAYNRYVKKIDARAALAKIQP